MIIGNGIDLIELERVAQSVKHTDRFVVRILSKEERAQLPSEETRQVEYVAGRFAAKEALAKALGCGIGKSMGWHAVAVLNEEKGKPFVRWLEPVPERMGWNPASVRVHVSITHSQQFAAAQIILEG